MKKIKNLLLLLCLFCIPFCVNAEELTTTSENAKSYSNEYLYQETLDKDINVNHNAFIAGNNTKLSGSVNGLLFGAGNNTTFDGNTNYAVLAGNNVVIGGNIENDLFAAGNFVTISKDAKIARDVYVAGNTVDINANINGNVFAAGNNVTFTDTNITGNVELSATNITFKGSVKVSGTLKYNSNAIITGQNVVNATNTETYTEKKTEVKFKKSTITSLLFSVAMLYVFALIIFALFPSLYKNRNKENSGYKLLKSAGVGLLVLIATPIISILVCVTIIGIPVGLISLLCYGVALFAAVIPVSILIGNIIDTKLFKIKENFYLDSLLGIIIVEALGLIPYVGSFIEFLCILIGLGMLYNSLKRIHKTSKDI